MGQFTLLPKQDSPHPGPDPEFWTNVGGAADFAAALGDASDTTYLETHPTAPTPTATGRAYFNVIPQTLPVASRVRRMWIEVRARRTTLAARRRVAADLDEALAGATRPGDIVATSGPGAWGHGNTSFQLTGDFETYRGTAAIAWHDGTAVTQAKLNRMLVGFEHLSPPAGASSQPDVQISELGVVVEYDERPNATATTSGDIIDTSTPLLKWNYSDDFEEQEFYLVHIRDPITSALVYSSGDVRSSDSYHQVTEALAPGEYEWNVWVAQKWAGPPYPGPFGQEDFKFWSGASVSRNFTIKTVNPASPSLVVTPEGQRAKLDLRTNLNMVSFDAAHFEAGFESVDGEEFGDVHDDINLSDSTSAAHSGQLGLVATFEAASPSFTFRRRMVPVVADQGYTLKFWTKNAPGSPALDITPSVEWRTDNASVATSAGSAATQVLDTWTEHTFSATAPATAVWASIGVAWSGGAVTDEYYLDDFSLAADDLAVAFPVAVTSDGVNRGGMFASLFNALTEADSTMLENHAWTPEPFEEMEVSSNFAFHGSGSLRMLRTPPSSGIVGAVLGDGGLVPIPEGATEVAVSYELLAETTAGISWSLVVRAFDSDGDFTTIINENELTVVGEWVRIGGVGTIPDGAIELKLIIQTGAATDTDGNFYADHVQVSFDSDVGDSAQFFSGRQAVDGPFTEVQYSEDGGTTWHPFLTLMPKIDDGTFELFDHEIRLGLNRDYRARNFGTVAGRFAVSPWSTVATSTDHDYSGVWLAVKADLGAPPPLEYNFTFDGSAGKTEGIDDGGSSMHFAGRKYPVAEWGEEQERSFNVTLQLPSIVDLDAFRELVRARRLLVYRDGRLRRGVGRIRNPRIQDEPGAAGWSATFEFELNGEQIGVDD